MALPLNSILLRRQFSREPDAAGIQTWRRSDLVIQRWYAADPKDHKHSEPMVAVTWLVAGQEVKTQLFNANSPALLSLLNALGLDPQNTEITKAPTLQPALSEEVPFIRDDATHTLQTSIIELQSFLKRDQATVTDSELAKYAELLAKALQLGETLVGSIDTYDKIATYMLNNITTGMLTVYAKRILPSAAAFLRAQDSAKQS